MTIFTADQIAALGAEYESLIGYNPFVDCPDIDPAEVAATLAEYNELHADDSCDSAN